MIARTLVLTIMLGAGSATASAQTTGAGYADALSPSLAKVATAMHATIRRNLAEAPVKMQGGVGMGPPETVRGAILTFNTAHNNEHYGNLVVYMRLKGHIPPSTASASPRK